MDPHDLSIGSPAIVLLALLLLLLWFYTVWQSYVIEGTRARLAGLREIWRETLSLDPAWCYYPPARIVQTVLDSSTQRLPRLTLRFLLVAAVVASRKRGVARSQVSGGLGGLPSNRLRQERARGYAASVVATRQTAFAPQDSRAAV
jgi:hypothetical protein